MNLELAVVTLRYSSWSIRPWLALTHSGLPFTTRTVELRDHGQPPTDDLPGRRALGSVTGLFPVLWIDGTP